MSEIAPLLLPWFELHGRKNLPWQQPSSAYRVWLSEIMLQQTQVKTVIPYFRRFTEVFPDINSLADADIDRILKYWAGLGYYARAHNLHKTAIIIRDDFDGQLPADINRLQALPGIGRSTAGAILSFAFGQPTPILDGNVKRVLARLYRVSGWPGHRKASNYLWELAEQNTPLKRVAEYNQALMDLGSSLCMRSRPGCPECPLKTVCRSFETGEQGLYPTPKPKMVRPKKSRWLLWHKSPRNLLLERRPPRGIWGGLWSLPELDKADSLPFWQMQNIGQCEEAGRRHKNLIKHQFTHYELSISLLEVPVSEGFVNSSLHRVDDQNDLCWVAWEEIENYALPSPVSRLLSIMEMKGDHYDS